MKTAAVYLRVSTEEQTTENQRAETEQLCRARGFSPVFYEENASAVKARPVFDKLMRDARAGRFPALFIWSLDRLHRSLARTVADVADLDRFGVVIVSVKDQWLDTSGPTRGLLVAIFGWAAQFERDRLVERTNAGLARARANGVRLGRRPVPSAKLAVAVEAVEARGWRTKKAAQLGGVSPSTLRRELRRRGTLRLAGRQGELTLPTPSPAAAAPKTPLKGWVARHRETAGLAKPS